MKHDPKHETGQSIVIITLVLVAVAALAAIVVDVGYAYVQRRTVQNAADAAAMAGSLALAQKQSHGGIADAVENYLTRNGVSTAGIHAYYVVEDAGGTTHILNGTGDKSLIPRQWAQDLRPPDKMPYNGVNMTVVGVYVDANKQFDTFFAKAIGFTQVTVLGNAKGNIKGGICSATNVFPVAVDVKQTFPTDPQTGLPVIYYEQTSDHEYTLPQDVSDGHGGTIEGYIQYLTWSWSPASGDTGATGLTSNMNNTSRSGKVEVTSATNPGLPGSAGLMVSAWDAVYNAWNARVGGDPVTLPIFDSVTGKNATAVYHIVGFASFRVTGVVTGDSTNPYKVKGYFQKWIDPQARGGCADFGISSVTENPPPPDLKRTLAGSVTFQPVVPNKQPQTSQLSADVTFVLDTSGSMINTFGNGDNNRKIDSATTAMKTFVDKLSDGNTNKGFQHQAAFVRFPQSYSNGSFSQECKNATTAQTYSNMSSWTALGSTFTQVKNAISAVTDPKGGTPLAQGLMAGRQIALGAGHKTANVPVIILGSDGLPNVKSSNGRTTGWVGSLLNSNVTPLGKNPDGTDTYPDCSKQATLDAYSAANDAKTAGILLFVIGTGGDFDPHVLQAIATPNGGGKTYYFTAGNTQALNDAYTSIAQTFQDLGGTCSTQQKPAARASNAQLTIKNLNTGAVLPTVYTLSNGEFVVSDVAPGRYQITAATFYDSDTKLTYNQFTDGPGGADIAGPIIVVGDTADTYRTDTYIRTKIDPCQP